jgi:hypothetical protein
MFRTLAALALCGALALPMSAPPAQAVPLPAPTVTVSVDVDGDGKADTVELYKVAASRYLLQVTTASRVSGVFFTSTFPEDWGEPTAWFGAAKVDKVTGYELMVYLWGGDGVGFTVYTWRSGRLVTEKAPAAPLVKGWYLGSQGYRFFTSHAKRYVDVSALTANTAGTRWSGKIIRSKWKGDHWAKVSTRTVKLTTAQAAAYQGFNGAGVIH